VRYVWNWRQNELSLKLSEQAEGVHYEGFETASSGLEPFDATVCRYRLETEGVSSRDIKEAGTRGRRSYSTLVGPDKERRKYRCYAARSRLAVCCRHEGHPVVTLQDEGK
jgi:hypothetical protein